MKEVKQLDPLASPEGAMKHKHDKMSNYAKYVKEMYWPQVSSTKMSEMEKLRRKVD